MLLLTVKGKEASSAVVLMTADSQLRKEDKEGFCGNLYTPSILPKRNSLDRKPMERTLENCDKDAEV